jgi:hypothetical protein
MYNKHREEIREKLQKAIRARARARCARFSSFLRMIKRPTF